MFTSWNTSTPCMNADLFTSLIVRILSVESSMAWNRVPIVPLPIARRTLYFSVIAASFVVTNLLLLYDFWEILIVLATGRGRGIGSGCDLEHPIYNYFHDFK